MIPVINYSNDTDTTFLGRSSKVKLVANTITLLEISVSVIIDCSGCVCFDCLPKKSVATNCSVDECWFGFVIGGL